MSETKVITGLVRMSYAHVFEPTSISEDQPKKYSVSLIIDKDDEKTIKAIEKAIDAAKQQGKDSKFGGKVPRNLKTPLRDGDEEKEDDEAYENSMYVNAISGTKPTIVDKDLNPIIEMDDFYSGCYGRASLNFYPYNAGGNKGIACGLNNLQKIKDGDPLSGGSNAEEDFGGDNSFADDAEDLM